MMEIINGYELTTDLSADNSGFGRWGFARKDGLDVFIKEFLSPVYPLDPDLFPTAEMDSRIAACNRFVYQKQKLYGALNRCGGGNIIGVLDFFRWGSKFYIVTEKVNAEALSMEDVFRYFPQSQKFLLAKVLCDSIGELHRQNIVHADLKPGNILLKKTSTGYFTAKIIDFDSSFLQGEPLVDDELEGDPVYLAPEMFLAMSGKKTELTEKVDVFSLGVLFYQIFFGRIPAFCAWDQGYAFEAVLNGKELSFPAGADSHLKKIIGSMLLQNPKKRPDLKKVQSSLDKLLKKIG